MSWPTAPAGRYAYSNVLVYNLAHIWEFFFPALLVFSWLFPVDRMRQIRYPRIRYVVLFPQLLHLLLMLLYNRAVNLLNMIISSSEADGLTGALMQPVAWGRVAVAAVAGLRTQQRGPHFRRDQHLLCSAGGVFLRVRSQVP